jgi:hypothetical protein
MNGVASYSYSSSAGPSIGRLGSWIEATSETNGTQDFGVGMLQDGFGGDEVMVCIVGVHTQLHVCVAMVEKAEANDLETVRWVELLRSTLVKKIAPSAEFATRVNDDTVRNALFHLYKG